MAVKVGANMATQYMPHDLARYASETDGTVILCFTNRSLLIYWDNIRSLPDRGKHTSVFDTDNILDKLTHLNIYKSPGPDGFHPKNVYYN